MANPKQRTFIIDCPRCKAKVAALEKGKAERIGRDDDAERPYGKKISTGTCPSCESLLVGRSTQLGFERYNAEEDY